MVKAFQLIGHGAEAKIYLLEGFLEKDNTYTFDLNNVIRYNKTIHYDKSKIILKYRYSKKYRHPRLDKNLRKYRTRHEYKILQDLSNIIHVPNVIFEDEDSGVLVMEYIEGKKLSDSLEKLEYQKIMIYIGKSVARMHEYGIVHGDLTTSNIILRDDNLFFIDFGLSFYSKRIEDFATDIHLLKEALESKHWRIYKKAFESFLQGYKEFERYKEVFSRLSHIEKRGRYKKNFQ